MASDTEGRIKRESVVTELRVPMDDFITWACRRARVSESEAQLRSVYIRESNSGDSVIVELEHPT